jgi:hypothetical protein
MYKQILNLAGTVSTETIKRLSDNAFIPMDEANADYVEYKKWLSEGNEPLPADEVSGE